MFPGLVLGPRPFVRDWPASRALWFCPGPHGPDGQEAPRGPSTGLPFLPDINIPGPAPCEALREGARQDPDTGHLLSRAGSWPLRNALGLPRRRLCT